MIQEIPEDESTLSAYLDGELDPESHQLVKSRVASNPQLVETLRRLGEVKELVSTLARPTSKDFSEDVLAKIRSLEASRGPRQTIARALGSFKKPPYLVGAGLAAAAALLAGLIPLLRSSAPPRSLPDSRATNIAVASRADSRSIDPRGASNDSSPASSATAVPPSTDTALAAPDSFEKSGPVTPPSSTGHAAGASLAQRGNPSLTRDRLLKLLDNPNLRKVFVITDKVAGSASRQVSGLIDQSVRSDYFAIDVAQGIVIDPEHPAKAKVFAIAIEESELERFRARLKSTLGDLEVEVDAKPELVTQLCEIGDVEAFSPPQVGEVVIPRSDVALKAKPAEPIAAAGVEHVVDGGGNLHPAPLEDPAEKTREGLASAHRPDEKSDGTTRAPREATRTIAANDVAKRAAQSSDDPTATNPRDSGQEHPSREIVVLIWISSPSPG